ncbi:Rpn family recombination-promoting nuclease/putative transposase [Lachnospiraceae bacterium 56-18]
MEKENREHKDSVFVDLFYQDETAKKNLLSLYNALHDTNYEDETIIRKVKIDDVLYKNFKNDISCEVNGLVLVFGEHQSTINRNMPLRCLMYVGRAYEQLLDSKARYRTTLVKIPTPEFYVFYNGEKEQPLEQVLTLSDAFMNPVGENSVELKVKVININSDKAHEVLDKCGILKEYSQFISTVRKYSDEEGAIKKAIKECIEKGILADYLKRKGSEVENMLIAEYSYEEDMQVKLQEGIWQGRREGITLSADIFQMVKKNPDLTNVQIAENLGCSVEDVESTRKMFGI